MAKKVVYPPWVSPNGIRISDGPLRIDEVPATPPPPPPDRPSGPDRDTGWILAFGLVCISAFVGIVWLVAISDSPAHELAQQAVEAKKCTDGGGIAYMAPSGVFRGCYLLPKGWKQP